MSDTIELLIRAVTSYDGGLNKVSDALKSIGNATGLSSAQLRGLEQEFQRLIATGLTFKQAVASIASSGNNFGQGVGVAAKQIQTSLNQAAQAAQNLNNQVRATNQAVAGLQNVVTNPLAALKSSAISAAASLGPLGLAIAGVGTLATVGAKALFDLVDAQGKAAQETVNMAAQIGISAGEMKKLQVEGQLIGVSFQSMQIAARQLAVGLEEPTGAGKRVSQALRELGIATQTASGQIVQEGVVFNEAVAALANIEDHTKRVEEATQLFGSRSSAAILQLINRYHELDDVARSLGYGDTTQLQEELAKGEEKINAMSAAWDLFKSKLAVKIEPIVIDVITRLTNKLSGKNPDGSTPKPDEEQDQDLYGAEFGWGKYLADSRQIGFLFNPLKLSQRQLEPADPQKRDWTDLSGYNPDPSGGLDISKRDREEDLAAGAALTKTSLDSFASSLEGMSAKVKEITRQITDDRDKQARGGLGKAEANRIADELPRLEAQKRTLEATIAAAKEVENYFKRLTDKVQNEAKYPSLNRDGFAKAEAQRSEGLDLAGDNLARQSIVNQAYLQATTKLTDQLAGKALNAEQKKIDEQAKRTAEALQKLGDEFAKSTERFREAEDKIAFEQAFKLADIDIKQTRSLGHIYDSGLRSLDKTEGGGADAILGDYQFSIAAAKQDENEALQDIQRLIDRINATAKNTDQERLDAEKQLSELVVKRYQTESDYAVAIAKSQMDAATQLAAYQKQQLDQYKQQAGSIFDALREPGGRGMQQWWRNQELALGRGVFSNATAPILQNIGQGLGNIGGALPPEFHGLFKGTVLDPARGTPPEVRATDANTDALIKSTHAIDGLTSGLTGKTPSGDPNSAITPSPASLAGAVAGLSGNAGKPLFARPGLPFSNIYTDTLGVLGGSTANNPFVSHLAAPARPLDTQGVLKSIDKLVSGGSTGAGGLGDSLTKALKTNPTYQPFQSASPFVGPDGLPLVSDYGTPLANFQAPSSQSASARFLGQLTKGIGNWDEIFNPDATDSNGNTYSTADRAGAAVGSLATAGLGIYEGVNQFSKGGESGILGGIGSLAGTAAALDPEPISKMILGLTGVLAGLFKGLMPDPVTQREAQIANQQQYNTYVAPPTLNRSLSASGGFEQVNNKLGLPSATSFTSVAVEAPIKYQSPIKDPTGLYQNWETAPGQVIEPYQSAAAQPTFITSQAPASMTFVQNISTMDAQSFLDNSGKIASALQKEVVAGHPVGQALQRAILGT